MRSRKSDGMALSLHTSRSFSPVACALAADLRPVHLIFPALVTTTIFELELCTSEETPHLREVTLHTFDQHGVPIVRHEMEMPPAAACGGL